MTLQTAFRAKRSLDGTCLKDSDFLPASALCGRIAAPIDVWECAQIEVKACTTTIFEDLALVVIHSYDPNASET